MFKFVLGYHLLIRMLRIVLIAALIFTDEIYPGLTEGYLAKLFSLRPMSSRNAGTGIANLKSAPTGSMFSFAAEAQQLKRARRLYITHDMKLIARASRIIIPFMHSGNRTLREMANSILKMRDNTLVIRYEGDEKRGEYKKVDYEPGTIPSKRDFESMLKAGDIKPVVIVEIKRTYKYIEQVYIEELLRISKLYNGNVTFIFRIEEPDEFTTDMPGNLKILHAAMGIMGESFGKTMTIQISDGGHKSRLGPISLRYHKQGLTPFGANSSYLQEVFIRAGRELVQMPDMGRGDHIMYASDTISEPNTFHPDKSESRTVQFISTKKTPQSVLRQKIGAALILFANGTPPRAINRYTPHAELREILREVTREYKNAYLQQLHHAYLCHKKYLNAYMRFAYSMCMKNGKPLAEAPLFFHLMFSRSAFLSRRQWRQLHRDFYRDHATRMNIEDWMQVQALALKAFGRNGCKLRYIECQAEDEGRLNTILSRFRSSSRTPNRVKTDPDIKLQNASSAKLDNVVIRGKGTVVFGGPNIKLRNVIIELKNNETLFIPASWVIIDSYIGGGNTFEEEGGILVGACLYKKGKPFSVKGKTLYREGRLLPLKNAHFKTDTCSSLIFMLKKSHFGEEPLFVSASLSDPTRILANSQLYNFEDLQWGIDTIRSRASLSLLWRIIANEFEHKPSIFPLDITARQSVTASTTAKIVAELARDIVEKQKKQRGKTQPLVLVEDFHDITKRPIAEKLATSLRRLGKNVVVLHEHWYRKSDQMLEFLQKRTPKAFKGHEESWYRWGNLRRDIAAIYGKRKGRVVLKNLYNPITGKCNLERTFDITAGTIVIYTGFYTHDIGKLSKYHRGEARHRVTPARKEKLPAPLLRVYVGMSEKDLLSFMSGGKGSKTRVLLGDGTVYAPAFSRYITTYDPAFHSDCVLELDPKDPNTMVIVNSYTQLWHKRKLRAGTVVATKDVVIFGAGAIGRGLYGLNFRKSGYRVHFVDADERLVRRLKRNRSYTVVQLKERRRESIKVDKVTATLQDDYINISELIKKADAICISVPDSFLPDICVLIGDYLEERIMLGNTKPIDIFIATNRVEGARYARSLILKGVSVQNKGLIDKYVGIVDTATEIVGRSGTERQRRLGSTMIYTDPFNRFLADARALKSPVPDVEAMVPTDDIRREKERKLMLFNGAHCLVAYLGHLKGHKYVCEAWNDPWVNEYAKLYLHMTAEALNQRFGFLEDEQAAYLEDIISNRFSNSMLKDPIVRVARDPLRKLMPTERFVRTARLLKQTGYGEKEQEIAALAIASCLLYDNNEDKSAQKLQDMIREEGINKVLIEICGIKPRSRLGILVKRKYAQLDIYKTMIHLKREATPTDTRAQRSSVTGLVREHSLNQQVNSAA